ncbi:MAG: TonB-dependent receptor [Acidobacteria bacterium]|nr:TonB-dependent receptor [Acidobacteriota bacterium]
MRRKICPACLLRKYLFSLVALILFGGIGLAQTTATISGSVKDASEAVLPGAEVTVTNVETGINRNTVTDDEGRYRVTNLNVGQYEIKASLPGFQTSVRSGISLTIGREAVVNFTLNIGEISEQIQVTGEAALVETASGSLGNVVDRETIQELPLNGRDLTRLIALQSGTVMSTTAAVGGSSGFSRQVSIGGARPNNNAVLLDGSEVKSVDGGVPAGVSGNFLGGEAIQEFKVERNAYSAQYGGNAGGVVNVVSKSGTNDFHGSIYEFLRNDNLDAANFRDAPLLGPSKEFVGKLKPEFKRNQFGASAGGPIIRNRTFFFGSYEGLRESLGFTSFLRTFTQATREGRLQTGRDQFRQIPVNPVVVPYLALWPLPGPGAEDLGDGTAREATARTKPTEEDFWQVRVDHNLSDADSFFVRFTRQTSEQFTPGDIPQWGSRQFVYNTFATIEERKIFSPRLLNTIRFSFNRRGLGEQSTEDPPVDPKLLLVPPDKWLSPFGSPPVMGNIGVDPVTDVGIPRGFFDRKVNYFQTADDLVYNRGAHSLKFGFDWRRNQLNGDSPSRRAGEIGFASIEDFLRGLANTFRGDILPTTDSVRGFRWNIFGWYIQDDWQASPRLTLNLGLRYEFYTVPTEVNGKISNLRKPHVDAAPTLGDPWFENPSLKSFMPRVGLAWDPTGSGKTAIRAGAGIFYNQFSADLIRRAGWRTAPFALETNISVLPGQIPFPGIYDFVVNRGGGQADMFLFPFDYARNPHIIQWNLNVQREILSQTAITVGYAGSRGLNLMHQASLNTAKANAVNGRYVFPADARLVNPNFTLALSSTEAATNSWYHSLQVGLQRRFQAGWQLQLSYTHSRTMDQSSQTDPTFDNQGGGVAYYWDPMMRRSLAAFHVSDTFSSGWVWLLPFGAGQRFGANWSGLANTILGGWQMGGIVSLASGPPGTISSGTPTALSRLRFGTQTPDLVAGASNSPVLGDPDRYFDTSAFALAPSRTIGNVGRNTLVGPGLATFDLSLTKNTKISEQARVQFRAEMFNLLNRANLNLPTTSVFNANGSPNRNAGFVGRTTTTARQIQFGLRVEW